MRDAGRMSTHVRSARPSELRLLAAIEASGGPLLAEWFGERAVPALLAEPPTGATRDAQPGELLVAVDASTGRYAGAPVGFAHLVWLRDDHGLPAVHLEQLSVQLPAHGRRGIGTSLVEAACAEARWAGHRSVSLCTYTEVPWNGPFYRRLGFVEEGHPAAYLTELRAAEQRAGLDRCGPRAVMRREL